VASFSLLELLGGMEYDNGMPEEKENPIVLLPSRMPLILKLALLLILLMLLIAGVFFAYQYLALKEKVNNQVQLSSEPKNLIAEVGRLIELPLDEEPTIATVSDVTKLKEQEFFKRARNGDKVLIYQNAKKAILYRPATKKIVDVGPVNIENAQIASGSAATTGEKASEEVSVALYNGTKRVGLTRQAETQLKKDYAEAEVVEKDNAKLEYKETVVIDITGKRKTAALALAKIVGGKVGSFPTGEATTSAQVLIILGENYQVE